MTDNNHKWPDFIKKLPGWITGFIAFVTAVVGFIKLWQGDTGLVTMVLLAISIGGGALIAAYLAHHIYKRARPPINLLVADFDGPELQKYRVTETVLNKLRQALEPHDDVQVEALGRAITEAEGSAVAHAEGKKRRAAIVIWGWYGVTAEAVPLSVHFEVLHPPEHMPELGPEAKGQVQKMAMTELESSTLQTHLSAEMAYLSLFTVGMARYAAKDWDGAIARFSDALSPRPSSACRPWTRAQSTSTAELPITTEATTTAPSPTSTNSSNSSLAPPRPTLAEEPPTLPKATSTVPLPTSTRPSNSSPTTPWPTITAGSPTTAKATMTTLSPTSIGPSKLQHDCAVRAYNNRGLAYMQKGEKEKSIADFEKVLELTNDTYWRQQAEEQLETLGAR
jgi:tetratricopeptide (TPR) repeat protein